MYQLSPLCRGEQRLAVCLCRASVSVGLRGACVMPARGYLRVAFGMPVIDGVSPTFDMSGRATLKMSPSGA